MGSVLVFAELAGVEPQAAFVAAGAEIMLGDYRVDGRLFLASRSGQVVVCADLNETYVRYTDIQQLAGRGQLSAAAELADENGLAVVSRLWLRTDGALGGGAWRTGEPQQHLGDAARYWWAHVTTAAMHSGSRDSLPVPGPARPDGEGGVTEISIRGDIGTGRNTAERILGLIGNGERLNCSVVVNIDSHGGMIADGMEIYRKLAEWPYAVYANIGRQASSMAAIIALAADVRTITPEGTMFLHNPGLTPTTGSFLNADQLREEAAGLDREAGRLAGVVAVATGRSLAVARGWMDADTTFTAGEALQAGLVHAVQAEEVPSAARPLRAKFAGINGPYSISARTRR